jgi:hypothetical protein
MRVLRDYEVTTPFAGGSLAEVFNAHDGRTARASYFTGPLHRMRATWWARWHTRKAVAFKLMGA